MMRFNGDEWSGLADLLTGLIEKYATVLEIDKLPYPLLSGEDNKKVEETENNAEDSLDKTGIL